jgi:formyl-CoA transferase
VAVVKDLVRSAGLFIHSSRPQAIERLGLGCEDPKLANPSIVYAYALAYAQRGPYGLKPAFDDLSPWACSARSSPCSGRWR